MSFSGRQAGTRKWNLIFVDGLHVREQVIKDAQNAILHLSSGGLVVLDDCWPRREEQPIVESAAGRSSRRRAGDRRCVGKPSWRPNVTWEVYQQDTKRLFDRWGLLGFLPAPR